MVVYHLSLQLLDYQIVLLPTFLLVGLTGLLVMMAVFERTPLRYSFKYVFG